jgi:hypothetical protein
MAWLGFWQIAPELVQACVSDDARVRLRALLRKCRRAAPPTGSAPHVRGGARHFFGRHAGAGWRKPACLPRRRLRVRPHLQQVFVSVCLCVCVSVSVCVCVYLCVSV